MVIAKGFGSICFTAFLNRAQRYVNYMFDNE